MTDPMPPTTEIAERQDGALPPGWAWTRLGEISQLYGGGTPSREVPEYFTGNIVWLTPTEIPKSGISVISDSRERITAEGLRNSSARIVPGGTVLMTSRASIGYVAIAGVDVTTNQGFANFVCENGINNLYLAYWLWSQAETFKQKATGTTFKEIIKSKLREFLIPVPPLPEQRRIVAKIEELLTRLDAGVAALKRVQAALKRYKAAVLKAACEGRLVPQDPNDEPASKLLERILAERRAKWEAELRAKGKGSKEGTHELPQMSSEEDSPELPTGWTRTLIGHVFNVSYGLSESLSKTEADSEFDVAVIRIPNVTEFGGLNLSHLKYFEMDIKIKERLKLHKGDVLFNWRNAPKWIGRSTVFDKEGEYVNASFLLKLRPYIVGYSKFTAFYMNYLRLSGYFMSIVNNAVNQANFNATRTSQVEMPLPPLREQERIADEVDRRMSVIEGLEDIVATQMARAEKLHQSILKRAFEGRLVAQDANDEPAGVLLERIQKERKSAKPEQRLVTHSSKIGATVKRRNR